MTLRDCRCRTAEGLELLPEQRPIVGGKPSKFGLDCATEIIGIASPRHQILKQDVTVGYIDQTIVKLNRVLIGNIRIVIAGEPRRRWSLSCEKTAHFLARTKRGFRSAAWPGIQSVPLKDD